MFPAQIICFYFQFSAPMLIPARGAPSPQVGAERENKKKNTKEKIVLIAIIAEFEFSGVEAVWCLQG